MKYRFKYWLLFLLFAPAFSLAQTPTPIPTIFATDEGLEGKTIAGNFHTIVANDWFVAIPAPPRALSDASWSNRTRVNFNHRSIIAPVWDIGPWNTTDDYWNNDPNRVQFNNLVSVYWTTDPTNPNHSPRFPNLPQGWATPGPFPTPPANPPLAQGIPEAAQALDDSKKELSAGVSGIDSTSYNYGADQFGRTRFCAPCTWANAQGTPVVGKIKKGSGCHLTLYKYPVGFKIPHA